MALNVDKLKNGLIKYNDSLIEHLNRLQADFEQLKVHYHFFANEYEGREADEFRLTWEQTMRWFEEYADDSIKLSKLLEERVNHLQKIDSISNSGSGGVNTIYAKGASKKPKAKNIHKKDLNSLINENLSPNTTYKVDGYEYKTDEQGRVSEVSGTLLLIKRGRNKLTQKEAKEEKDGFNTDHGGHLIAQRFNGPAEKINLVPMDGKLNSEGGWKKLEDKWAESLKKGKSVHVKINIIYDKNTSRPVAFEVLYIINHEITLNTFKNTPK